MPRMTWRAVTLLSAFALMMASHGQARRESDTRESVKPAAALKSANEEARSAYKAAREHLLAEAGPVVLFDGDDLIFRYGSHRRVRRVVPALYEDLKTVGHVVMGLHALIAPYGDGKLDERRLFVLARYLESVEGAGKAVARLGLNKERLARQKKILDACRAVLKKVIRDKAVVVKDVVKELRALRPLLDENNTDAARPQIDAIHKEMLTHKSKLSEADWKRLTVIVQGSAQPRKDHLAVQYFARLLGLKGEGDRLIYAESLWDEQKALALWGSKEMDRRIGADLFGEPLRIHRDLLGEAAKTYLDELFKDGK